MKMKNYCVLMALVCSAFLCAMDGRESSIGAQEDPVKSICDKIDKDILGVDPDGLCKWIQGSCASVCKSYSFAGKPQEAITQLSKIESYIPSLWCDRETFQRLKSSHWLVHYLLYELVRDKVRQLNAVTGSTIDDVLNVDKPIPGLSPQMSKFINQSAHDSYVKTKLLDQPIEKFYFDNENNEIHYQHLKAWDAGEVYTLVVPKDGTCVKGITGNAKSIAWCLEKGQVDQNHVQETHQFPLKPDELQCFKDGYIIKDDYLVVLGNTSLPGIKSITFSVLERNKLASARRMYKESEIFLLKKPDPTSLACQIALCNCSRSSDTKELMKLKNSQAAQSFKGFPQRNLFEKIDTEIKSIASVRQALEGI